MKQTQAVKADVVSRVSIFVAGVTQADNHRHAIQTHTTRLGST
jgi:hypothetical protein